MHFPILAVSVAIVTIAGWLVDITYAFPADQGVIKDSASASRSVSTYVLTPANLPSAETQELALQVWHQGVENSIPPLKEILHPATELIEPIVRYVAGKWFFRNVVVPALRYWLGLVGFQRGGIAAGELSPIIPPLTTAEQNSRLPRSYDTFINRERRKRLSICVLAELWSWRIRRNRDWHGRDVDNCRGLARFRWDDVARKRRHTGGRCRDIGAGVE
jgi:hypothetical protein